MTTTGHSLSSFDQYNSLIDHSQTKQFDQSAKSMCVSSQYANYDFIAVLDLAQRLRLRFLLITWQTATDQIEKNDQTKISQALINIQTSFAFKIFNHAKHNHSDHDLFKKIIQEMIMLSHSIIQKHKHIVTLEEICWDISKNEKVWSILIFEKSHLEDFDRFAQSKILKFC
jgi:hypothetical protein